MSVYIIGEVSNGKITSKTSIGKFTRDGWIGNASSLYDSASAGKLKWEGDHLLYAENRSGSKLHFGTDALYRHISTGYLKLLDSGNYNSYTPKLDGTGATGTWGINITGNANTATTASSVAWANVSGKSTATQSASGLMSASDKKKLDGIAENANNYSLPKATTSVLGGVKAAGVRDATITKTVGGTTTNRYYGVELDSNGAMFVNIPWSDTNTKVNVTLGTTTKAYLLGTSTTPTSTTQAVTAISDTGVYLDTTAGRLTAKTFNATSDNRLKENLIPFTPQKSILDLPIYKYDFISGAKGQIGCMAQDL